MKPQRSISKLTKICDLSSRHPLRQLPLTVYTDNIVCSGVRHVRHGISLIGVELLSAINLNDQRWCACRSSGKQWDIHITIASRQRDKTGVMVWKTAIMTLVVVIHATLTVRRYVKRHFTPRVVALSFSAFRTLYFGTMMSSYAPQSFLLIISVLVAHVS